jgi:fructose-1,6-bisphosphatase/inositol monophosphatase family enzyme
MTSEAPVDELAIALAFATALADEVRAVVHGRLATGFNFARKPDRTFVTEIDVAVEELVRQRVGERFPAHRVLGEEQGLGGAGEPDGDWLWVVDPIDGTHSLRHRVPLFGTLLALLYRDQPVLGLIDLPMLGRRLYGAIGVGGFRDQGEPFRLADLAADAPLDEEIVATGERGQFVRSGRGAGFDRLMAQHPRTRTYCDCFGHLLALEGAVGAMVDPDLRLWDAAATLAIAGAVGARLEVLPRPAVGEALAERRYDLVFGRPRVVAYVRDLLDGSSPA